MKSLSAVIIALVVVAAAGCAGGGGSATVAPTVDVTGKWAGTFMTTSSVGGGIGIGQGTIELTLKQTGSQVTGNLVVRGAAFDPSGPFEGTVSGNELRIIQPSKLNGTFTVQGDRMSADVREAWANRVYLERQK